MSVLIADAGFSLTGGLTADNIILSGNEIVGQYLTVDAGLTVNQSAVILAGEALTGGLVVDQVAASSQVFVDGGVIVANGLTVSGGEHFATDVNYISDTGANNAITATVPGATLVADLRVCIQLGHTLQAGANTFAINGGSTKVKSHLNVSNNIATGYAATGLWCGIFDGTEWVDLGQ